MILIILPVCFILVFYCIGISKLSVTTQKELLLITVLVFSALIVSITELLSVLNQLNFESILTSWSTIGFINLLYIYFNREQFAIFNKSLKRSIYNSIKGLTGLEIFILSVVLIILMLVFAQGILYPPNNWDSMTYHLARITSWVSHQSVAHYPTHITRQLYQPPFAEYVIMHVDVLNQSDYFSNSVQFFYFLFCIAAIVLIMESFGLSRSYKIIGIIACVTIPEVILQASSTQNDIVVSLFIIAAFYFSIKAIIECKLKNYLFLGLAIGLGTLTKGTAYLYLAPVIIFFTVKIIIALIRTMNYKYIWFSLITISVFIVINFGHYSRNYQFTKNILGVDKQESRSYSNQKMNPALLFSNLVKNAGLHMGFMYINDVSTVANTAIYKLHSAMGININDPDVNYRSMIYSTNAPINNEDTAPNMLPFIFMFFSLMILGIYAFRKKQALITSLLIVVLLQIILFCLYLKWQPWNSRLHIIFFLMSVPLICYTCSISNLFRKAFYIATPVLLAYTFLIVLHNNNRPYTSKMYETRYQKYFMGRPEAYTEYDTIYQKIAQSDYTRIGLNLGIDDWEYPLFKDCFNKKTDPVYILVNNPTKNLWQTSKNIDCIVTTKINHQFIDFNGRRFYNQSSKNKVIYFYK